MSDERRPDADPDPESAEPAEPAEPAEAAEAAEAAEPAEDETRRRFREALARKKGRGGGLSADHPGATPHPHTSPAKPQRQFRRKSG